MNDRSTSSCNKDSHGRDWCKGFAVACISEMNRLIRRSRSLFQRKTRLYSCSDV